MLTSKSLMTLAACSVIRKCHALFAFVLEFIETLSVVIIELCQLIARVIESITGVVITALC